MHFLHEIHPTRTAARHHGKRSLGLKARQKFRSLFQNRHVRRPVDVADVVCAHLFQRRDDLPFDVGAGHRAEGFAQRDAYGGGKREDRLDVGVVQPIKRLVGFVLFRERSRGADQSALAALHAFGGIRPAIGPGNPDAALCTETVHRENGKSLNVAADFDAAPAAHAFRDVAHETVCGRIDGARRLKAPVAAVVLQPNVKRQVLQFAVGVSGAA